MLLYRFSFVFSASSYFSFYSDDSTMGGNSIVLVVSFSFFVQKHHSHYKQCNAVLIETSTELVVDTVLDL